jgi:hypothetical protein
MKESNADPCPMEAALNFIPEVLAAFSLVFLRPQYLGYSLPRSPVRRVRNGCLALAKSHVGLADQAGPDSIT